VRALLVLGLICLAGIAAAQPASLVADSVRIEADSVLVAEGNVEVFYEGARLSADRITYDAETEALTIEGPVRLTEGDGAAVLFGDTAELDPGLRDGILTGARLVLDQQLQVAADELAVIDERYRRLTNAVASTCRICAANPTPLWEIRAARVLHDTETRQIYFSRAQFRVVGVPVLYVPRLRLPDPTVVRARGFLAPRFKGSGDIGTGVAQPYFVPLGPSADVTVAPFITPRTRTVELRYRQAFRRGTVQIDGALSRDDLRPDDLRGYAFGTGVFTLPRGFVLNAQIQTASDDEYLDSYGYFEGARLQNRLSIDRVRPNELVDLTALDFDILRPGDLRAADRNLLNLGEASYIRAVPTRFGRLSLELAADAYERDGEADVVGRDVQRIGGVVGWMRGTTLPAGIALTGEAEIALDGYRVRRDQNFDPEAVRVTPVAAVDLRWPLVRAGGGVAETLEPVAQLVWSAVSGDDVPDEDSRVVDLDEGNLFALDRFPGSDRSETGMRVNLGVGYSRLADAWAFNSYVGRVFRFDDTMQFSRSTGLDGAWSDWLVSAQLGLGDAFTVTNRAVFDELTDVSRNELRLALEAGSAEFASSYLWLVADPEQSRNEDVHEAVFTAAYEFSRHWAGAIESRWDIEADRVSRTDLDLTYRNECLAVDVYLSQRYDDEDSLETTYDFGVEVSLQGIGRGNARRYARSCPG
jgi:LPS-assembly protein